MVWDEGTYVPEREIAKGVREGVMDRAEAEMQNGLVAGMLKLSLYGQKLQGSFAGVPPWAWEKGELAPNPRTLMVMRKLDMIPMRMRLLP